mgnify:CR=1 FL=1
MPKIGLSSLKQMLQSNVCEVRFTTRRPWLNGQSVRNMMCTLDYTLLHSVNGRTTLNFAPPHHAQSYNPESKNLLNVWDIIMQDWRMVNMNDCDLINAIPRDDFWEYFNQNVYPMSIQEKNQYMGR